MTVRAGGVGRHRRRSGVVWDDGGEVVGGWWVGIRDRNPISSEGDGYWVPMIVTMGRSRARGTAVDKFGGHHRPWSGLVAGGAQAWRRQAWAQTIRFTSSMAL